MHFTEIPCNRDLNRHSLSIACVEFLGCTSLQSQIVKMGKKESKKRSRSDSEDLDEDNVDQELEAEMVALASMRAEKLGEEPEEETEDKSSRPLKVKKPYNKEGILQALETIGKLPFIESYQISEFSAEILDEHDDLEREVSDDLMVLSKLAADFLNSVNGSWITPS